MRHVCAAAMDLTRSYERLVLFSYDDHYFPPHQAARVVPIIGTLTIGYGHTGPDVQIGDTITEGDADILFEQDVESAAFIVERDTRGIKLSDNQFGALTDFVFRVGIGHFESSTLLKELVGGNFADIPDQIRRWDKVAGRKSAGLDRRCEAEVALWLKPDSNTVATAAAA